MIRIAENPFDGFLQELRKEAINQGIRPTTLDSVLKGLVVNPKVLALYRRQPEKKQDLSSYLKQRVSTTRITLGQKLLTEHQPLLEQVSSEFGVQSSTFCSISPFPLIIFILSSHRPFSAYIFTLFKITLYKVTQPVRPILLIL